MYSKKDMKKINVLVNKEEKSNIKEMNVNIVISYLKIFPSSVDPKNHFADLKTITINKNNLVSSVCELAHCLTNKEIEEIQAYLLGMLARRKAGHSKNTLASERENE